LLILIVIYLYFLIQLIFYQYYLEVYSIEHYVVKFVSALRQVSGFLRGNCMWVRVTRSLVLCVMFCRFFFLRLSFFFWPLYCLSFDLRILITPLVSSNCSFLTYIPWFSVGILVYANTNPSPHSIHKTAEIDVKKEHSVSQCSHSIIRIVHKHMMYRRTEFTNVPFIKLYLVYLCFCMVFESVHFVFTNINLNS
jgi:hypothetical protein